MSNDTFTTDDDTRALIADLERELGVTGTAAVFRKTLAIAKEAGRTGGYSGFSGAGVQTVIGSQSDIDLVQRWCHEASTIPHLQDRIKSAESRAASAEAEVERLKARLEIDRAYDTAGNQISFPAGMEHLDGIACRDETIRQQDEQIAKLTAERDAAIKVQEMCAMSGGFNARWAENATKQRDAAEASASALRDRVAVLENALKPFVKHAELYADWLRKSIAPNPLNEHYEAARAALNGGDHV